MTVFTVPDLGGGAAGPPGPAGPSGAGGVYGSIFAVLLFSAVNQVFTANVEQKIIGFGTNLANNGVTPDQANDRLLILEDGVYEIYWMQSYRGTVNFRFNFMEVRNSGVLLPELSMATYEGAAGFSLASGSCTNAVQLSAGDVLEMFAETNVNVTITWRDAGFLAWRVA